jgi:hypothetical protein
MYTYRNRTAEWHMFIWYVHIQQHVVNAVN